MARFAGFDHIDARVRDLTEARPLYDAILPALGLSQVVETPSEVEYYEPKVRGDDGPRAFFGLHEDPDHIQNETCIAFTVPTPADVDRLAKIAKNAGAIEMEGPEIPYSSERYYAVFFRDANGNRLEVCYRRPHTVHGAAELASG